MSDSDETSRYEAVKIEGGVKADMFIAKRHVSGVQAWLIPSVLALGIIGYATTLPGDANWDLRSYHIYNPFALLTDKFGFDVAPAGVQTFLSPLLDVPYYLLQKGISSLRSLNAMLAVPHAVAVVLAYAITLSAMGTHKVGAPWLAAVAVVFGVTGAASLPTLATTMSEMVPVSLVFGAVLSLMISLRENRFSFWYVAIAGLLSGAAIGSKLTVTPSVLGLVAGWLAVPGVRIRVRLVGVCLFAGATVVGACIIGGFWWYKLYEVYGNPVFPFYNDLFRSPWYHPTNPIDGRFFPRSTLQWFAYPFFWAFTPSSLVYELPVRDPRFALALLAVSVILVRWFVQRPTDRGGGHVHGRERLVVVFFAVSFAVWQWKFSILRYLAGLELLTGTMLLLAVRPWLERIPPWSAFVVASAVCVSTLGVTVYPRLDRAAPAREPVDVLFPPIPPDSVVVLLDPAPMAYTAAFAPRTVRFLGAGNHFVAGHPQGGHQRTIREILSRDTGPIWGMDFPSALPGVSDVTLTSYGLRRTSDCSRIRSNLDGNGIRLCRLERSGPGPLSENRPASTHP